MPSVHLTGSAVDTCQRTTASLRPTAILALPSPNCRAGSVCARFASSPLDTPTNWIQSRMHPSKSCEVCRGLGRTKVAVARKLSLVLHRMWMRIPRQSGE
jgi:hypothetical protein